jgi:uncharacterized protein YjiK
MAWIAILLASCTSCVFPALQSPIGYRLNAPDETFEMPKALEEISGLGLTTDGKYLIAVQDEDGLVFFINKTTGRVEREVEFWKDGDYEGVEVVGEDIFVVKSTGTVYKMPKKDGDYHRDNVEKYNFFLNDENDVEGLAHDAANNRLLLACKAKAGEGANYSRQKGIYSFDLAKMELEETPAYTVSLEQVLAYLSSTPYYEDKDELLERFEEDDDELDFAPSSIGIHPVTGQIYILSSVGKLLMVIDRQGEILHLEKIKKKVHNQPEGLCFDRDGTLYIANEGDKNDEPKIYRFDYRKR